MRAAFKAPNRIHVDVECSRRHHANGRRDHSWALGSASRDICNWGGTALDLAIAVLESKSMRANYPLGDVYPNGQRKCGDAANFGIFKQNWLMIRSSWPAFADLSSGCYLKGAILNSNLRLDIDMLHGCQNRYGLDRV